MAPARGARRTPGNKIDCPIFDPDIVDFEHWREDIQVWQGITTTRKSAQGGVLYLAIDGKAKQHVHTMDKSVTTTAEGFDAILKILDEVYMPEVFEKNTEISTTSSLRIGRLMSHYNHL